MERKKRKEGDGGDEEERERARSTARSDTEDRRGGKYILYYIFINQGQKQEVGIEKEEQQEKKHDSQQG